MLELLTRNWWVLALRGILAIVFGFFCLARPGIALVALVILFGIYILVDGILAVITGLSERQRGWGILALEGILLIIAGIFVFRWPLMSAVVLLILFAIRAIVLGVLQIIEAVRLRKQVEGEWQLALAGILSILLGVLLFILPAAGVLALVWLVGIYAIIFGVLMLSLGFRLKGWGRQIPGPAPA